MVLLTSGRMKVDQIQCKQVLGKFLELGVIQTSEIYSPTPGAACIELAFGALKVNGDSMGCDLRPIDPAHPQASQAVCGDHAGPSDAGSHAGSHTGSHTGSHYNVADLGKFGEMGKNAGPLWEKFLAYYGAATGEDGALTRREKAPIGLAVAHAKQYGHRFACATAGCRPQRRSS